MSRIPAVIVLAMALLLLVTPAGLYAQRGARSGGGAVAHMAPGSSFAGRPAPVVSTGGIHRPIGVGRPVRPIIVTQPFGYYPYYGYGYSYGYSPYYSTPVGVSAYADPAYTYAEPAYTQPAYVAPEPAVSPDANLTYQIGMLSQQIEQLRQEQAQRSSPPPAQSAESVVLIFRDGHRQEIHNFAIVGNTLWVLDEKSSTKISVGDLDIDATQKENRSRGVRFPLPAR